jgi:hypothetical protein
MDGEWPPQWRSSSPGARCPNCGAASGWPILWGMPLHEVVQAIDAGDIDIVIGGCAISDEDPMYHCSACGTSFGNARRSDAWADDDHAGDAERTK